MGIIITMVIISRLTINSGIVIVITITAIGKANDWLFCLISLRALTARQPSLDGVFLNPGVI